jgi:hypothetical protein
MPFGKTLRYIVPLTLLFYAGCATLVANRKVSELERPSEYVHFFKLLDETVAETGVHNASVFQVAGFPYLRTNRFLTGLKNDLDNEARREQWLRWLRRLDLEARRKEIRNLSDEDIADIAGKTGISADRKILYDRIASFSEKLLAHDRDRAGFFDALRKAVTNPDEYSTALRVVGLYPLVSIPVASITRRLQRKFRAWHHLPTDQLETLGEVTAYRPVRRLRYSQQTVQLILNRSRRNALDVPLPSDSDRKILLAMFAPIVYQDVAAVYDRIGEIVWSDKKVSVDPGWPTVYHYVSHALRKGQPVLQLNYVFWYSARNGPKSPWIEKGPLDGLTVRVSLDDDGLPFMVDIMNNCGCYHFFAPHPMNVGKTIPVSDGLGAFVPRRLPESYPREPMKLRIVSGWHQVARMNDDMTAKVSVSYQLRPYDRLEALPHGDGTFESIFTSKGIVKNTARIEPLIFFPMGIPQVGSMRQRGHHAVKFVGREIFDDPDIFDRNFEQVFLN